jgi:hypothetical protein
MRVGKEHPVEAVGGKLAGDETVSLASEWGQVESTSFSL